MSKVRILIVCFIVSISTSFASERVYNLAYNRIVSASVADMVIEEATKYIGTPYRWGGKTPSGFDCAGFTRFIYGKFGVSLAPAAAPQYKAGVRLKKNEIAKGDLVFFGGRGNSGAIGHVGIVTDVYEGGFDFIHASSTGVRITKSNDVYYVKRYIGACRVIDKVTSNMPADNSGSFADDPAIPITVIVETPVRGKSQSRDTVTPQTVKDTLISIAMVGDMMLGTTYPTIQLPQNDGKNLFDDVREILRGATIAVGNCEGAICDGGTSTKGKGKYSYSFRMPTSYASLFRDAGFDFLSLANNHSNDFGREGIKSTMTMLDSMHIKYAGVKGECRTALLKRDGITYGFCAFGHNSYTYRHQEEEVARGIIKGLRDSCDILVVSFHGGAEGKDQTHLPQGTETFLGENRGNLRHFTHMCIDEGADIVYGHGPHVCRAMEVYKGHLIAYSLGNFCTPAGINVSGISGYAPVVVAYINRKGELVKGRVYSFIQPHGMGPRTDADNKVAQFMRSLTKSDFKEPGLVISDDGSFRPVDDDEPSQE